MNRLQSGTLKKISALAVVAAAVGAAAGWWFYWPQHIAKDDVRGALNDPDSAKFRDVRTYRDTGGACGYVNARNRMGGYVGWTMFVTTSDGNVIFEPGAPGDTGPIEDRLAAGQKQLEFLKLALNFCPEPEPEAK